MHNTKVPILISWFVAFYPFASLLPKIFGMALRDPELYLISLQYGILHFGEFQTEAVSDGL